MTLDTGPYLHTGPLIYGSVGPLGQRPSITTSFTEETRAVCVCRGHPSPWRLNLCETGLGVGLTRSQRGCGVNTVRNQALFLTDVCWEHEYRHAVLEKGWDEDGDFQLFRPTQDPQSHASCRVQHAAYKHGCWRAGTRLSLERLQLPLTPSAHPPRDWNTARSLSLSSALLKAWFGCRWSVSLVRLFQMTFKKVVKDVRQIDEKDSQRFRSLNLAEYLAVFWTVYPSNHSTLNHWDLCILCFTFLL